tara:strand:+ start:368 stop:1114 length:747 start_codon:yes stop_codon:yes gene_type:complete
MEVQFESTRNKGLVWGILMDNEFFKKSVADKFENTRELFEDCIKIIENENKNSSVISKNKSLIKLVNNKLMKKEPVLIKDIKKEKQELFNNELKKKEIDFQNSMKVFTPETIDFSDKIDEPISNLDEIMEQKLKERKYESLNDENIIISEDDTINKNEEIKVEDIKEDTKEDTKEHINDNNSKTIVWEESVLDGLDEDNLDIFSKLKQTNNIDEITLKDLSKQITSLEKKVKSWFLLLSKKIEDLQNN